MACSLTQRQLMLVERGLGRAASVERLAGDRRAVVACIMRDSRRRRRTQRVGADDDEGVELLFILRAGSGRKSRWDGQAAFPGGHVEACPLPSIRPFVPWVRPTVVVPLAPE